MRVAADGTLLYMEGSSWGTTAQQRLLVVDLEGNEEDLPLDPRAIQRVSWSPDGQSVTYSVNVSPDKAHFVAPGGHGIPSIDLTRETLDWFDRYLGEVR